ncbi:GNAT family N-acetyltransferase [Blautia schinkii]|nr:GNAT family N-acetyltransferase [Blautia schinkii]
MIEYKRIKDFEAEQLQELFLSVEWYSGNFPEKLRLAMNNSSKVISAWEDGKLIGLIRGLDDGVWQATIDCLLVNPAYQGKGIASTLLKYLLDEYVDFLYVDVVPDEKKNVEFYVKHGFKIMTDGTPLQIKGDSWKK